MGWMKKQLLTLRGEAGGRQEIEIYFYKSQKIPVLPRQQVKEAEKGLYV